MMSILPLLQLFIIVIVGIMFLLILIYYIILIKNPNRQKSDTNINDEENDYDDPIKRL